MSQWYAVRTVPLKERKVAFAICQKQDGPAVFLPMEAEYAKRRGWIDKGSFVYEPLMPGYVFTLIDEGFVDEDGYTQFHQVLQIEGVIGFVELPDVRGESRPFAIPMLDIIALQASERAGRYTPTWVEPKPKPYKPKKGDRVKVIAGSYLTLVGTVTASPRSTKVRVQFDNGLCPDLKVSHITPVDEAISFAA